MKPLTDPTGVSPGFKLARRGNRKRARGSAARKPNSERRGPLFCQPNQIAGFGLHQQSALPAALALSYLGVVGEAGEWVARSGVVEIFRVRLQELMELL